MAAEETEPPNWGLQFGGPGVFEVMFRPRIAGPLLLEVGAFFAGSGGFVGNGSFGLVVEIGEPSSVQPYAAFGGGFAGGCGEGDEGLGCSSIAFGYSRVGLGFEVGERPPNLVTVDVGAWVGGINSDDRGYRRFAIPMGGVGYYF
jgi:hypothetical protein